MPHPPAQSLPRQRLGGFTLVEMIMVIAVIGILMALLLGALGQIRKRSADSRCLQQLRQLSAAGLLSAADNGGRLPYRGGWASATNAAVSILPYLGIPLRTSGDAAWEADSALTCLAAQAGPTRTSQEFHRTYSINQYATGGETGNDSTVEGWENHVKGRQAPRRLQEVRHPAQQAFFMDGAGLYDTVNLASPDYRYSVYTAPDRLTPSPSDVTSSGSWRTPYVHGGRIYVAYLDGHVGALTEQEARNGLIGPTNSAGSTRTNLFWGAQQ